MKKIIFTSALVFGALVSCTDENSNKNTEVITEDGSIVIAKNVDAIEFKKLAEAGKGQILDVRTPQEVVEGYIEGAIHLDIYNDNFKSKIAELDKEKPVYVYCKSGGRSGQAMDLMMSTGFKKVYNLDGGIGAWDDADFAKVK